MLIGQVFVTPLCFFLPFECTKSSRKDIRNAAHETLQQLYKADPPAKAAVKHAAGYAVFNNFGMKILVAGSGTGKGIAVNNKTKK